MDERDRIARIEFGISLGMAFGIAASLFSWQGIPRAAGCLAIAGGAILGATALRPEILRPLERAWGRAARGIRWIAERPADGMLFILKAAPRAVWRGRSQPPGPGR